MSSRWMSEGSSKPALSREARSSGPSPSFFQGLVRRVFFVALAGWFFFVAADFFLAAEVLSALVFEEDLGRDFRAAGLRGLSSGDVDLGVVTSVVRPCR